MADSLQNPKEDSIDAVREDSRVDRAMPPIMLIDLRRPSNIRRLRASSALRHTTLPLQAHRGG